MAASLLLFLEEEDAFWMMCAIIEELVPASYFSTTLMGVQTDQRVLRQLIVQYLPRLDKLLQEHDIGKSVPMAPSEWFAGRGYCPCFTKGEQQSQEQTFWLRRPGQCMVICKLGGQHLGESVSAD